MSVIVLHQSPITPIASIAPIILITPIIPTALSKKVRARQWGALNGKCRPTPSDTLSPRSRKKGWFFFLPPPDREV